MPLDSPYFDKNIYPPEGVNPNGSKFVNPHPGAKDQSRVPIGEMHPTGGLPTLYDK